MKDLTIQQRNERQGRLERMACEGRLMEYFRETFKHREYGLACVLMNGFDNVDHENLKDYLDAEEGQQTQSEMNKEEGAWLDRQR